MISGSYKELLQHMLGADERYKKKQWGFRNHYCSVGHGEEHSMLLDMEKKGLVYRGRKVDEGYQFFRATTEGAKAIGFKPYQLRKLR